ncbi:hypothetical protein DFH06DRAFT_1302106 [Mycena polygramma]|nr:hypothetical protein DFH06DRAFT_1302106 [Mycena polygramma]
MPIKGNLQIFNFPHDYWAEYSEMLIFGIPGVFCFGLRPGVFCDRFEPPWFRLVIRRPLRCPLIIAPASGQTARAHLVPFDPVFFHSSTKAVDIFVQRPVWLKKSSRRGLRKPGKLHLRGGALAAARGSTGWKTALTHLPVAGACFLSLPVPKRNSLTILWFSHECGEPGHLWVDCPQHKCYNCGVTGHIAANCTQATGGRIWCSVLVPLFGEFFWQCGGQGHLVAKCPQSRTWRVFLVSSSLTKRRVLTLLQPPMWQTRAYSEGMPANPDVLSLWRTGPFRRRLHATAEVVLIPCPFLVRNLQILTLARFSYACGKPGHEAKACRDVMCYKCRKFGHVAAECPTLPRCPHCGSRDHSAVLCNLY